jgi:uncharacterized protein (TIGR00255 family)
MTGFGRGRTARENVEVLTEIRAVNHRFLDISLRLPKNYSQFEPELRKLVSEFVSRGKYEISVNRTGEKAKITQLSFDEGLATDYHAGLVNMKKLLGLAGDITIADMLTLKELVQPVERDADSDEEWSALKESVTVALNNLDEMRRTEGAAIWADILSRIAVIGQLAEHVHPMVGQVTQAYKERLSKRILELTGGIPLDEERLIQEVAVMAERSDVTEELTRMESHLQQFHNIGKLGSPLGRKIDFLLQELHREINTLGSKSASTDISGSVVDMKAELEKIREQIQNIE